MEMVNKKHDIQLEIITPVNIGAGGEKDLMKGVDFVEKDESIYLINLKKMISEGVDVDSLATFFANKQDQQIVGILGNKINAVSDAVFDKPASTANDIKAFIKNEFTGKPIIPGSSLKGTVRSVLFKHLRSNETKETEVFGSANKGDEFMRFIKISDFAFEKTVLSNTKIFNLKRQGNNWSGGWKHSFRGNNATTSRFRNEGFNTIYEVLPPGAKGYGSIMLAYKAFRNFGEKNQKYGDKKAEIFEINNLFKIINNHTEEYLLKQLDFFNKYTAEKSDLIIENIEALLDLIPKDDSYCLIKMSAGSGFHSITGDWQFDDYTIDGVDTSRAVSRGVLKGKKSSKSRKVAILNEREFSLMGFVKIRLFTEEEKLQQEAGERKKREAEIKRKEKERELREQQEKRENDYLDLIKSAIALYEQKNLSEALTIFKNADNLLPDGDKHTAYILEIENKLKRIEQEELAKKAAKEKEEEAKKRRKAQIEGGLSFLDEKFDDGKFKGEYKVNDFRGARSRIEQWLKRAGHDVLPTEEHEQLVSFINRIYVDKTKREKRQWESFEKGVWSVIIKWIGKENAKALYDKLI